MLSRDKFVEYLWDEVIDVDASIVLENLSMEAKKHPRGWEAKINAIMQRLLSLGAQRDELSDLMRWASYEATFGVLYAVEDPGVRSLKGLYEELLGANPRE